MLADPSRAPFPSLPPAKECKGPRRQQKNHHSDNYPGDSPRPKPLRPFIDYACATEP